MEEVILLDLGFKDYLTTLNLQRKLVDQRIEGKIKDCLILVEHDHVFTLGKRGNLNNILVKDNSIPIYQVERGGDVTYHGKGQIVGYPIISLQERNLDIGSYIRSLEEVILRTLKAFNIEGYRLQGHPGVWYDGKKLCSIGLALKKWVSYHGFALNVNTDLRYFQLIRPCGLEGDKITSMKVILRRDIDMNLVKDKIISSFEEVFNCNLKRGEIW